MQLLDHFKELTLHPKNAQELKGLILQLAIQGKLTKKWRELNPNVESASVLLEKIKEKKAQLVKEKKIKKEKSLSEIDKISIELPENWCFTRLGAMGLINPRNTIDDELEIGFVPMRDISQTFSEIPKFETREWVSVKKSFTHFRENDVAFAKITPCFENSKACVFKGLPNGFGAGTTELHVFRKVIDEIDPEFVYCIVKSPLFLKNGEDKMTGSAGQKRVPKEYFSNYVIGLPPYEEQKAIVATVNQLFKEMEALEEQTVARVQLKEDFVTSALQQLSTGDTVKEWSFMQEHFKTFFTEKTAVKKLRETILQLAVQGKLTKHWRSENPDVEPASLLLEKIKAEKAQLIKDKKIKKEKPLPEITAEEIPYELPEGWSWCRLGDVTTIKGGKRLPKGESLTTENTGRVYIRVTDMKNGTIDDSRLHYVTEDVFKIISQYIIEKEDLYLTIVGATIGKLGLVPERFHGMSLTENAARIIRYQIAKEFLYHTMISDLVQNQFFDKTNQVGVPKLALHRVAKTLMPLPPLEEQKAIVAKVNALMGLCDGLEKAIEDSTTQVEQLMQSCLKEVFEGDTKEYELADTVGLSMAAEGKSDY
ncbi:MAG: restriction endonuclease subunit S [Cyclobacteriaceae bacterium]